MKKAEAAGNDNCPVKIKLVAPPLYVLTTQTLDKVGITLVLNICGQLVIAELFDKILSVSL
jgi:translation initiation factor 2 subunit 1